MFTLHGDLRYAARLLSRTPAFTFVAVATLERRPFSLPDYRDLRDRSQSFDGIATWSADTLTLSAYDAPAHPIQAEITSAGYFDLLGAAPVAGRVFTRTEDEERDAHAVAVVSHAFWRRELGGAQSVAIVSRRFAAKTWPGVDPMGKRFTLGRVRGAQPDWIAVVGVAPDLRYRSLTVDAARNPEDPDIYFPLAQRPARTLTVMASATGLPSALILPVRDAVQAFDRDFPTSAESTFADLIAARTASFRLSAGVMSFFGVLALLLAAIGVYGLLNYSVAQRRQEIGVRGALGAGRGEIYRLVMRDALKLIVAGLVIGLAVALPGARLLGTQLYGVTPADPLTYGAIMTLLLVVGVAATLLPAARAARLDPMTALRGE